MVLISQQFSFVNHCKIKLFNDCDVWLCCCDWLLERRGEASTGGAAQGRGGAQAPGKGEERQRGQGGSDEGKKGQGEVLSNWPTKVGLSNNEASLQLFLFIFSFLNKGSNYIFSVFSLLIRKYQQQQEAESREQEKPRWVSASLGHWHDYI